MTDQLKWLYFSLEVILLEIEAEGCPEYRKKTYNAIYLQPFELDLQTRCLFPTI